MENLLKYTQNVTYTTKIYDGCTPISLDIQISSKDLDKQKPKKPTIKS